MEAHELGEVVERRGATDRPYLEFIRVPDLSVGLYVLPAGGADPQRPHSEDEVYHVVGGRGRISVGDESRPVRTGSVIYIPAGVPHRFGDIEEDLSILVFFAPAEGARGVEAVGEPGPSG